MNATRQTATIFPTEMIPVAARSHGSPRFVRMPRPALGRHTAMVQTIEHSFSIKDVCELIKAAGPLQLRDIAGGLDVPEPHVSNVASR